MQGREAAFPGGANTYLDGVGAQVGVPGYERCRGGRQHFQAGQTLTLMALEHRLRSTTLNCKGGGGGGGEWGQAR